MQARNQLAAAESLYVAALAIYRQNRYSDAHLDVRQTHSALASLYEASGNADRAAAHRAILAQRQ
jgi:hypothetical protein